MSINIRLGSFARSFRCSASDRSTHDARPAALLCRHTATILRLPRHRSDAAEYVADARSQPALAEQPAAQAPAASEDHDEEEPESEFATAGPLYALPCTCAYPPRFLVCAVALCALRLRRASLGCRPAHKQPKGLTLLPALRWPVAADSDALKLDILPGQIHRCPHVLMYQHLTVTGVVQTRRICSARQ